MSVATLDSLKDKLATPSPAQNVAVSMDTVAGFESMQRIAKLFASSDITPARYRGKLANCFIAVDMAMRMGANPLMVFQNLYEVHGQPAWSAQFLIATFNKSGRFSALRYEFEGKEGQDNWGCRAVSTELATKEKLTGPLVTIALAKKEGWYGKNGSKWQSMPELMLRYRAAAWFVRTYAPEIAMGLQTVEEVRDSSITLEADTSGVFSTSLDAMQDDLEKVQELAPDQSEQSEQPVAPREKRKAKAEPEPAPQAASSWDDEASIECPKGNPDGTPKLVSSEDCFHCKDKNGCPEYEGA